MKNILLIGDSIRRGYDKYTRMAFEGVANVYYTEENCRFAAYVLRHLIDWKTSTGCPEDVDCVHWNAGLWDCLVLDDGEKLTPVEVYGYYIERVCKTIKSYFPKAKVIFATSTPVVEERFVGCWKRYNKDIELYNKTAVEIAKKYGFEVNDLYELVKGVPVDYYSDMTHLYTKKGTELIANHVIKVLEDAIDAKASVLDYDKLFGDTEVVGM